MSDETPTRRRLAIPAATQWPRVGKIRLGEQLPVMDKETGEQKQRAGEGVTRPAAIDYFRVDPNDGITDPDSAASFLERYGEKPTTLRCQLPAPRIEDCWEGAYRLYGARKVKLRCDGEECDERTKTGGWETKPCVCKARGIFDVPRGGTPDRNRCKLGWTLQVLLPDVKGVGVWQLTTGSEISVDRVSRWLQMLQHLVGNLAGIEFTLNLVPADVTPDGVTKTVYVLNPVTSSGTPQDLIAASTARAVAALEAGQVAGPATPPVADDDEPAHEGDVVDTTVPGIDPIPRPDEGSDEEKVAVDRLERMTKYGLTKEEVGAIANRELGRTVGWWELVDDSVAVIVDDACRAEKGVAA